MVHGSSGAGADKGRYVLSTAYDKQFEANYYLKAIISRYMNRKCLVKHIARTTKCLFSRLDYRVDVNTLEQPATDQISMSDIARVALKTQLPLVIDEYKIDHGTGSFIVIDEATKQYCCGGDDCLRLGRVFRWTL